MRTTRQMRTAQSICHRVKKQLRNAARARRASSKNAPDDPQLQKAYEKCLSHEMCNDLTSRFARKSARNAEDAGSIRLRYSDIVCHLRCLEPLSSISERQRKKVFADFVRAGGSRNALAIALSKLRPVSFVPSLSERLRERYQTNVETKRLLVDLEHGLRRYLQSLNDKTTGRPLEVEHCKLGAEFTQLLAKEWLRDPQNLFAFLAEVFGRWCAIDRPDSLHRRRIVTYQIAAPLRNSRKEILDHLQKIGAIPKRLTGKQLRSWLSIIGQHISRDAKATAVKNFGFRSNGSVTK